ncbi:ribosome recycling factor [Candidatus Shapirobacteria bacterium]|nr:ribosome recycling factor [Candidatus Shapirobacteria bacterium]
MHEETRKKMTAVLVMLREDLALMRTSQATPSLVENITVGAYEGSAPLKLKELATITAEGGGTILIQPWDAGVIKKIVKAINEAEMGLTPMVSGNLVRIQVPPLSTERREEYVCLLKNKLEASRVMIRRLRAERRAEIREAKEKGEISEDEAFFQEEELQKLTNEFIGEIDLLGENKEKDLRQV